MIGGNTVLSIQEKTIVGEDRLGKPILEWETIREVKGFLDLLSGDSRYTNYNAKLKESSHVFICDYFNCDVSTNDIRALVDGHTYDVTFIDDPMGLHQHLEIFLEFVG